MSLSWWSLVGAATGNKHDLPPEKKKLTYWWVDCFSWCFQRFCWLPSFTQASLSRSRSYLVGMDPMTTTLTRFFELSYQRVPLGLPQPNATHWGASLAEIYHLTVLESMIKGWKCWFLLRIIFLAGRCPPSPYGLTWTPALESFCVQISPSYIDTSKVGLGVPPTLISTQSSLAGLITTHFSGVPGMRASIYSFWRTCLSPLHLHCEYMVKIIED